MKIKLLKEEEDKSSLPGLDKGIIQIKQKVSSDLVWVRVMDYRFFSMKDCDGNTLGIVCQNGHSEYTAGKNGYESFTLLQKYEREGRECWRNLISITMNTTKKYVGEFKQQGNQFVGRQTVYGVSGEKSADLFFSFMEENFPMIGKYSTDIQSLNIPKSANEGMGYATSGLYNLMKYHTERFREYTYNVPDVLIYMHDLIRNTLGEEFFVEQKSVSEVFEESPKEFFEEIPELLKHKRQELLDFMGTIDIFTYFQDPKIRPSILKNLMFLINYIKPENFGELLNHLNIHELFLNGTESFKELARNMSAKGGDSKKMLFQFIDTKFLDIIKALGGGGVGLGKLINMLKRPKLDVHKDAKLNPDTGNFEVEREERKGKDEPLIKVKKIVSDDSLILSSKEIKNLLDKHKEEIKKFFDAPGKNPDIEYMRFFVQHLPEGQYKGQLYAMKDQFIDYYNKKFDAGTSEYPGKMLYDALLNQLKFRLGEKTKRKSFSFKGDDEDDDYDWRRNPQGKTPWSGEWHSKFGQDYPFVKEIKIPDMTIQDMSDSKFLVYLLKYFYKNLKPKIGKLEITPEGKPRFINSQKEEVTQALSNFLYITAALNGCSKEAIETWMNKINSNFIKMGQAERDPNKYKMPQPSPGAIKWAQGESLYLKDENKLDEAAIRSYINNKIIELWTK